MVNGAPLLAAGLGLAALLAAQGTPAAGAKDSPRVLAVLAERFLTVSGDPVDHGVMLVQGGKIQAIGPRRSVAIPAGAEVLDLEDRFVCPGFVDLHHHVSAGGGDINDMVHPINAELRTLDAVRPSAAAIRRTAAGGVTTTCFIPGSGTSLGGFGVLLKMTGGRLEDMVIRELGAMKVAQGFNPERPSGDLGATRMGTSHLLHQTLLQGKAYAEAWRAHEEGRGPKPELRPDLEQLRRVFERKVPVLIHTAGARDIVATARMFQDVYGLWMILSHGCFDGWWAATAVAKRQTPVNLGPRNYQFTRDGRFQGIPQAYWDAGCRDLSLNTDAPVVAAEQLFLQASMAVRLGLPHEVALRALTLTPAKQVGVGDRVGSLEVGKDADFLVTAGDPLDPRHGIERVYIEGRLIHMQGQGDVR